MVHEESQLNPAAEALIDPEILTNGSSVGLPAVGQLRDTQCTPSLCTMKDRWCNAICTVLLQRRGRTCKDKSLIFQILLEGSLDPLHHLWQPSLVRANA